MDTFLTFSKVHAPLCSVETVNAPTQGNGKGKSIGGNRT